MLILENSKKSRIVTTVSIFIEYLEMRELELINSNIPKPEILFVVIIFKKGKMATI